MPDKNVIRIVKGRKNPYSMIANEPVLNKTISFRARGILWLCLSRPDDWQFNAVYLNNMSEGEGRDAVATALRELEDAKYIYRTNVRDRETNKFAGSMWLVFEVPYTTLGINEKDLQTEAQRRFFEPLTENPFTGNPYTGKPYTGNPTLLNTDSLPNTDEQTTEVGAGTPATPPAEQPLLFTDTESLDFTSSDDLILEKRLKTHASEHGRRGAKAFASQDQKARFREAIATIREKGGAGEVGKALDHAFTRDHVTRQSAIDSLHRWAENLSNPKPVYTARRNGKVTGTMTHDQYAEWAKTQGISG